MAKEKTKTFEEKMKELNIIVEKLNDPKTSLDDSIKLYDQGLSLTVDLQKVLKEYQAKIEKINSK